MRNRWLATVAALAAVVVVAATAVASTMSVRDEPDGRGRMMSAVGAGDEFTYLTHMVAHHEEAVRAASQLTRSDRPQLRALGRRIVASQSAQIEQMNGWLTDWYPGRSTEVDYQPMMRDLSDFSGDRLDRAFLRDMVGHHMAAIMMSQQLLVHGGVEHAQVADLARTIRDDQHAEVLLMQRWLAAWFGDRWRHWSAGMGAGMMW